MIEYFLGKKGFLTAKNDGFLLHSLYDPIKEAQKWVESKKTHFIPRIIVLVNAGIGYIEQAILKELPTTIILSVAVEALWHRDLLKTMPSQVEFWPNKQNQSLTQFLSKYVSDINLEGVEIWVWPAGLQANRKSDLLLKQIENYLRQQKQSFESLCYFAKRWFKNSVRNFLQIPVAIQVPKTLKQVLIIASGPSLGNILPQIEKHQRAFYIIALPSALLALKQANIEADCVVAIDGGFYATWHLANVSPLTQIIASYNSALPSKHKKTAFFSLNTFFEKSIAAVLPQSYFQLPWQGSVVVTAIHWALRLANSGDVIVVGLDMAINHENLKQHVRPHTFEAYYARLSHRYYPLVTYYQQLAWHAEQSLPLYAQHIQNQKWPKNLKYLSQSSVKLPFEETTVEALAMYEPFNKEENQLLIMADNLSYEQRLTYLKELWQQWYKEICTKKFTPELRELCRALLPQELYLYDKNMRCYGSHSLAVFEQLADVLSDIARQFNI